MLVKEGDHAIVQQVRGRDRVLLQVQFAEGESRVRIHERFLIDAPHSSNRAHVERVL